MEALALLDPVEYPVGEHAAAAELGDDVEVGCVLVEVDELDDAAAAAARACSPPPLLPRFVAEVAHQRYLPVQVPLLVPLAALGDRLDRVKLPSFQVMANADRHADAWVQHPRMVDGVAA